MFSECLFISIAVFDSFCSTSPKSKIIRDAIAMLFLPRGIRERSGRIIKQHHSSLICSLTLAFPTVMVRMYKPAF